MSQEAKLRVCGSIPRVLRICLVVLAVAAPETASGEAFTDYAFASTFDLPAGASVFDILHDGRLIALSGGNVYVETGVGTHTFDPVGNLPEGDFNAYGAAFARVSPDGTTLAVGNNGGASYSNFQVGVFDLADLTGDWLTADHYDAEWYDNTSLAITTWGGATSVVTMLDTTSDPGAPTNPTVVDGLVGASAGITFDAAGNLYTGNGYTYGGPSDTGWIKHFDQASWTEALNTGVPLDFEAQGTLIADLLSATALGLDAEGNLHVGGGDLYGGSGDYDYAGLIRASVVADAIAGLGPADPLDPNQVRRFDPDPDPSNCYDVNYNTVTGELYVREGATVYAYVVPEPASLVFAVVGGLLLMTRRIRA